MGCRTAHVVLQIGEEGGGGGEERSETRNYGTALEFENLPSSFPIDIGFGSSQLHLFNKSGRGKITA